MKKKYVIIICIVILVISLLLIFSNILKEKEIYTKGKDNEYITCLEEQLGAYFVSEKTSLKKLSLDKITNHSNKIKLYRGFYADTDNNNEFVIMKSDDKNTVKEFDNYFYNKYEEYQTFMFESNIRVYAHNTHNDIALDDIYSTCNNVVIKKNEDSCEDKIYKIGEKSDKKINNKYVKIEATNIHDTYVTLTMTNLTNDDYFYGNPFTIEVEKDGEWYKMIAPQDLLFNMPLYTLKAKEQLKFKKHGWYFDCNSVGYGKLPKGHYRIIKDVNKRINDNEFGDKIYISAEFNIE